MLFLSGSAEQRGVCLREAGYVSGGGGWRLSQGKAVSLIASSLQKLPGLFPPGTICSSEWRMLLAIRLQPFAWSVRKPHNCKGRMTSGWVAALKAIPCSPQLTLCTAILHTPSPCSLDTSPFSQSIICAESLPIPSPQVRESVGSHPSTLALRLPPSLTD